MQEFIHVTSGTHIPTLLGSSTSPFKYYPDGLDPNDNTPFGEEHETMYLAVTRPAEPTVNNILYRLSQQSTEGTNGVAYPGAYVAEPKGWVVGWDLLTQDIETSRLLKIAMLNTARDARVAAGYELNAGDFPVPLTEDMGVKLSYEADQFERAVASGDIPATSSIQFFGANGAAIEIGVETLRSHSTAFYLLRKQLNADYMGAITAINSAETPEDVDAVTWTF